MAVNPYAPTEGECQAVARLGVARLERELARAEREVEKRSRACMGADPHNSTPRLRARLRARLTTACESRDRYRRALEIAREAVAS